MRTTFPRCLCNFAVLLRFALIRFWNCHFSVLIFPAKSLHEGHFKASAKGSGQFYQGGCKEEKQGKTEMSYKTPTNLTLCILTGKIGLYKMETCNGNSPTAFDILIWKNTTLQFAYSPQSVDFVFHTGLSVVLEEKQ